MSNYLHNFSDAISYLFQFLSGGLSNFLYYVSLPKLETSCGSNSTKRARKESYHNMSNLDKVPCSVLLRIYGQTHGEHALETMLTESVVFALLSERQLGPKLHGIFPGGRIEQYIPVSGAKIISLDFLYVTCDEFSCWRLLFFHLGTFINNS